MKNNTNAVILAAGMGMRLKPKTDKDPKGMIKLFKKSLLEMQIENFRKCGIDDITIVTGHMGEKINFPNINYIKNSDFSTTNINHSLFCAKEKLESSTIICYSDIIYEKNILEEIINFDGDFGIGVRLDWKKYYKNRTLHPVSEAENVLIENDRIIKIQKNISKSNNNQSIGEFLGLMKLSQHASNIFTKRYSELQKTHVGKFHSAPFFEDAYITDMIQEIINLDYLVKPVITTGKWCEIDTSEDLQLAKGFFIDN